MLSNEYEQPFGLRLGALKRTHELTFRSLEARLRENAPAGERTCTSSHLAGLVSGKSRPTPEVIRQICRAFDDVEPESFIEWRLWQIQRLFDPERAGLEAAVAEMHAFEKTRGADASTEAEPAPRWTRRHSRAAA